MVWTFSTCVILDDNTIMPIYNLHTPSVEAASMEEALEALQDWFADMRGLRVHKILRG